MEENDLCWRNSRKTRPEEILDGGNVTSNGSFINLGFSGGSGTAGDS